MILFSIVILIALVFYLLFYKKWSVKQAHEIVTPEKWKKILEERVLFYKNLDESKRKRFEIDVYRFLAEIKVIGVQTEVTLEDRLLVASSAVIPLFGFPAWSYNYLDEVLLYPSSFDRDFNLGNSQEIITGMVGTGAMEGKMILSKPSLHAGFDITNDKRNVGIHEFVHLFDKENGSVDGVPPGFEDKAYALPWLDFINEKTNQIISNRSDIDGYATTNRQEFFAVACEYFFESPHLLKKKHPKLYDHLTRAFNQGLTEALDPSTSLNDVTVSRNEPCPCGSGEKYKRCCLN